jgi:hypothetical protein
MINMIGVMFGLAFSAVYESSTNYWLDTSTLNPTWLDRTTTLLAIATFLLVCYDFFIGTQQTANHYSGAVMDDSFNRDFASTVLSLLIITVAGACVGARTEAGFMGTLCVLYVLQLFWAGLRKEKRQDQEAYQNTDRAGAVSFLVLAILATVLTLDPAVRHWTWAPPVLAVVAFVVEVCVVRELAKMRAVHKPAPKTTDRISPEHVVVGRLVVDPATVDFSEEGLIVFRRAPQRAEEAEKAS